MRVCSDGEEGNLEREIETKIQTELKPTNNGTVLTSNDMMIGDAHK